ncbi:hypothetical protein [uncultured Lactobacillus sp.]|uniref:hypothetical protein n=1 Tax=uncultured Lactobacillus sp. TaxID=153152 RepID=UPI00260C0E41|nr:hypothetical protein [uncultured Lactobacillus sp.]
MKISKSTAIAGSALVATAAGVTVASTPLLSVTAHADTSAEAYVGIQGDAERDTNSSQHSSKAFEYMTPDEAAATWTHKEDWEKEPGTDNTQTDWAIAQNTNGKTSSDTSSNVFGDSSEARFNPGDVENSKMTSLGWMKDEDNDGVKIINLGTNGSDLIVSNNNNNSSNNSNNSNVQNNKGKNTSVGKENNNAEKAKNSQNGNFANAVTQIGQNIQNNKDNVINPIAGGKYIINGGNASGVENDGNGTYVIRTADGTLVVSNNNNNNNNNSSNNNSNNGISSVDDNCKDKNNTLGIANGESEQKAAPNATVSTGKVATTATVPTTSATASTLNTKPDSTEKNSESISSKTNTPVSSTTSISTTDPTNKLNSSENSTPTTIGTATNTGTLPQTSNSQDTKVASVGGVLLTSLAAMGIVPAKKALQ